MTTFALNRWSRTLVACRRRRIRGRDLGKVAVRGSVGFEVDDLEVHVESETLALAKRHLLGVLRRSPAWSSSLFVRVRWIVTSGHQARDHWRWTWDAVVREIKAVIPWR